MSREDEERHGLNVTRVEVGSQSVTAPTHLAPVNCKNCHHPLSNHSSNPCSGIQDNGEPCKCTKFQE